MYEKPLGQLSVLRPSLLPTKRNYIVASLLTELDEIVGKDEDFPIITWNSCWLSKIKCDLLMRLLEPLPVINALLKMAD